METAGVAEATRSTEALLTAPGSALGTVSYMSPEQVRAQPLDARTDLFSLGVVLYEMATGKAPFRGESTGIIFDAILNRAPVPPARLNPDVPAEWERIIDKCLEKDRGLRYQHAADIRADLQRLKRDTDSTRVAATADKPATVPTRGSRWMMGLFAGAILLALLGAGYAFWPRRTALTDKDTLVLADFRNTTGDPVFDETLRQGLAVHLGQSPFLSLVSDDRIQRTLRLMGLPTDTPLTPDIAEQVCARTESAAVLEGSIASLGTQYVVGLRAKDCRSGDVLDEEQAQAARKEDVLNTLSDIANAFRTRVGESLATIRQHSTPLAEATTPSLDALKAFSEGWRLNMRGDLAGAEPLFKRALEIDPQFAFAYATLGLMYSTLGESVLATENTTKAYQLRDRASDRERFFITALYDRQVTGNLVKARQTLELWTRTYPRSVEAHGLLAGFSTIGTGQFDESIDASERALALDPDMLFAYVNIASSNLYLDRPEASEKALQRLAERKLDRPDANLLRYYIAFLKGDREGMDREVARAQGQPDQAEWMANSEAFVLARSGQLERARAMSRRAVDPAAQAGRRERAAMFEAGVAAWEGLSGNMANAQRSATQALERSTGRDVAYVAAFALALAGDSARARALADGLDARFPEDTSVQFHYLPALRALLALNAGEPPSRAVELLQPALAYESGVSAIAFNGFFGSHHPVYVRGLAYLAAHQGAEAAAEFQRILDHRGMVLGDPLGAVARLQLGRALVMAGDMAKAKAAYESFLALWKDADAGVPLLTQARAEYAGLR